MTINHPDIAKILLVTAIGSAIFTTSLSLSAAVSQQPLSLTEGVAPNLLVTLDTREVWLGTMHPTVGRAGALH